MKKIVIAAAFVSVLVSVLAALATTPALAADMLVKKAPPRPPAPAWSWTGFYLGANVGGGWGKSDWFEDPTASGSGLGLPGFQDASINASGILGGGQIGFDYQNGWAVFGIQADADATGIRGNASSCFPEVAVVTNITQSCSTKIDAMGTVTGRIGAAVNRTLFYVAGGYAWEHEHLGNPCVNCAAVGVGSFNAQFSGARSGWTVAVGPEYALAENWSTFLQYNYFVFDSNAVLADPNMIVGNETEKVRDKINVIKAGINYRFNWEPVAAAH
jgi:outer membrane immunogenic protein